MKKIFMLLFVVVMVLALAACEDNGGVAEPSQTETPSSEVTQSEAPLYMSHAFIDYFFAGDYTAIMSMPLTDEVRAGVDYEMLEKLHTDLIASLGTFIDFSQTAAIPAIEGGTTYDFIVQHYAGTSSLQVTTDAYGTIQGFFVVGTEPNE